MSLDPTASSSCEAWRRFPVRRIEDLRNAVLGADLEAMQMAGPPPGGSLAFRASRGIVFSTGLIDGKVGLRGALAEDAVTLMQCLTLGSGSRLWLDEAKVGEAVVVMPRGEFDAIFAGRSAYVAATLTEDRLRSEVAGSGHWGDCGTPGGATIRRNTIPSPDVEEISRQVALIHRSASHAVRPGLGSAILRLLIGRFACSSSTSDTFRSSRKAEIVRQAREYIHENLAAPIRMSDLVLATGVSARTLHRAFKDILEETPQGYVRRARLHRVRRDLVSRRGVICTIGDAAARWGAGSDPGRLAVRYRELFGEKPSMTLATARNRSRQTEWM